MLFWPFSNIIIYVKIVVKIPDQHLNVWVFSNPRDNVQKRWRTTGQICPVISTRIRTLSPGLENNHTFKCWSGIFPTILTYTIMLENYQNNISVYGCSPIQGTKLYSCWNLKKPGFQSGTYWTVGLSWRPFSDWVLTYHSVDTGSDINQSDFFLSHLSHRPAVTRAAL